MLGEREDVADLDGVSQATPFSCELGPPSPACSHFSRLPCVGREAELKAAAPDAPVLPNRVHLVGCLPANSAFSQGESLLLKNCHLV